MSAFWSMHCSTNCGAADDVCEKWSICLSSLLVMGGMCFKPVDISLICTRFLVDLFFLSGLILLRGEDDVPLT